MRICRRNGCIHSSPRLRGETGLEHSGYDDIFKQLSEEKRNELMDRKQHFAEAAGIKIK